MEGAIKNGRSRAAGLGITENLKGDDRMKQKRNNEKKNKERSNEHGTYIQSH